MKKVMPRPERLSMVPVWDMAGFASSPDLLRYDSRWLVAFREASAANAQDGAIRIMSSLDGVKWSAAGKLDHAIADLDRPRLHTMPDGQILLTAAVTMHANGPSKHRTYAWKSRNGSEWTGPQILGEEGVLLDSIAWRRGKTYGFGYDPGGGDRTLRGYMGDAENELEPSSPATIESAHLGQTSMIFLPDDTAIAVSEHANGSLHCGVSRPPYRHWDWKDLAHPVADPRLMRMEDGRLLVSGADAKGRSALYWLDAIGSTLVQAGALNAESTQEGASIRWHDGALWTVYRAANNAGSSSIYLARIKLP